MIPATKNPSGTHQSELRAALADFHRAFVSLGVFSCFINLLMIVPSIYMLQVYDRVLASRNQTTLVMLTLIMVAAYLLMSFLEFVRAYTLIRLSSRLDSKLVDRVFKAAFEQNLKVPGSNAGQSLHDLMGVRQFLTGNGLFAFFDAPWFPFYAIVIFLFHPVLCYVAMGGAALLVGLTYLTEKLTKTPLSEANKLNMAASNFATNNLRNAEVIESMGMLPNVQSRWYEMHTKHLHWQSIASDRAAVISQSSKFIRMTLQSLMLGVGAFFVIKGEMTPGGMIAASILSGRMLAPVELAIGSWKQLVSARSSWNRLELLLHHFPQPDKGMTLPKPKGLVQADNVMAGAPGSKVAIIKGVSFVIQPGEVVAILGASASGKTTLARLLVGVWPTLNGKIRLDGSDIYTWNKTDLGPSMGYLPQDIELFDGTLAENICRFGEVDSEKVVSAAQRAGVHEIILRLPNGYDTKIGANSGALSGGQRQRVGLARAMYGDPSFIVLDEPNSNLDDAGEAALVRAILDLKSQGTTVIVISHRVSTLVAADKIMVMREGTIAAFGPRDEILASLQQATQQAGRQPQENAPAQIENHAAETGEK